MKEKTLTELLIPRTKYEVLKFLLNNKRENYTISELSENIDVSYASINNFVKKLEKFGIIKLEKKGSALLVSVNKHSPYIETLEELGSLDARPLKKLAKEYTQQLKTKNDKITTTALFGSVAEGIPDKESDIDILILVENKETETSKLAEDLADKKARNTQIQISPLVMTEEQFKSNIRSADPLALKIKERGLPLTNKTKWNKIANEP